MFAFTAARKAGPSPSPLNGADRLTRVPQMHAGELLRLAEREKLLAALRTTLRDGIKKFRQVGELHMLQLIERFDGARGTRLAWLHHGIAQEMYHRGQLTLYARLMGLVPALTKRIQGEASRLRRALPPSALALRRRRFLLRCGGRDPLTNG